MSCVDVVIPCYNYGRFLRECVDSVLGQPVPGVRVLIIDDTSPDETPEVAAELVAKDPRVSYTRHAENRGHIATYNEGLLNWTSAKYSLLLSADDYLLPGALARAVAVMERHPEVGLAFGPAYELHPNDPPPSPSPAGSDAAPARIFSGIEFIEKSGAHNLVPTATAVVRTELQKQVGGYRPELPHAGDMEMWLRFAAHGAIGMVAERQAVYRRHDGNMSLSYSAKQALVLPDLRQRAAAFAVFFAENADLLPDAPRLRARTVGILAAEALWHAHAAFEAGRPDACREFAQFAEETFPAVRRSRPWVTLAVKRRLGHRIWRAVAPAAAAVQGMVRPYGLRAEPARR